MFKKKFLLVELLVFLIFISIGNVFAIGINDLQEISKEIIVFTHEESLLPAGEDVNGDLSIEEGGQLYVITEKDIQILNEKNRRLLEGFNNKPFSDPDDKYKVISVPVFEQENNYYCGPATVKQVIDFIKGSSKSQSFYAKELGTTKNGTDMTVIPNVLSTYTGKIYVYYQFKNSSDWIQKVVSSVDNRQPAILDINTNGISAFPYKTSGHFINISGYELTTTKRRVRITDPFGPGLGNRWYNLEDLYNANFAHFRKAMIW